MSDNDPRDPVSPDDERVLQQLAADILDGRPVDWEALAAGPQAALIDELRSLAAVTDLHRAVPASSAGADPLSEANPDSLGMWGSLRLIDRIGSGSFSEVFRAWDTRLDRQVALKLLYPSGTTDAFVSTIVAEGRLLAKVRHPNVVTVFGAERIEGRVGIWTEFVDGVTLAALVQQNGPMGVEAATAIGVDVCLALAAVHAAGLVHGDVKAQNVLRESGGRVVLVDLGTGREHHEAVSAAPRVPLSGTPLYMAPELFGGAHPSAASDLYSLGVLLYFLVSGTFPVAGATADDVRAAHARGERVRLAAARPAIPGAFAALVDRAISPDPSVRPGSAKALADALQSIQQRPARRRRLLRVAAGLVAVAAVGAALTAYALRAPRRLPTDAAATEAVRTRQLTFNSPERAVLAATVSADGQQLAYAAADGVFVQALTEGSVARAVAFPRERQVSDIAWLLDGSLIVAGPDGLWRATPDGRPPARIGDPAGVAEVSPDGTRLSLVRPAGISIVTVEGQPLGQVVGPEPNRRFGAPAWSPDGARLAYGVWTQTPEGIKAAIETRRVDGTGKTVVLEGGGLYGLRWHPDGRLLMARPLPPPRGRFANWWALRVDPDTGDAIGEPRQITDWPDFNFGHATLTADGRLVAVRRQHHLNVYQAELDAAATALTNVARLVLASTDAFPSTWTPSGDALLFYADQKISRQPLDQSQALELITRSEGEVTHAQYSPDGAWLFYILEGTASRPDALMRRPAAGGPDQKLLDLTAPTGWVRCTWVPASVCFASEEVGGRLRLRPIDSQTGAAGAFIERPPTPSSRNGWDISPDGTKVVTLEVANATGRLVILDLATGQERTVTSKAWGHAQTVAWRGDGIGWILTTARPPGGQVYSVEPSGTSRLLWSSSYQRLWNPTVAPDGRRIAFSSGFIESNVWLVEGL